MVAVSIQFRVMDSWVQYNTLRDEGWAVKPAVQYSKYSQFKYHHRSSYRNTTISH